MKKKKTRIVKKNSSPISSSEEPTKTNSSNVASSASYAFSSSLLTDRDRERVCSSSSFLLTDRNGDRDRERVCSFSSFLLTDKDGRKERKKSSLTNLFFCKSYFLSKFYLLIFFMGRCVDCQYTWTQQTASGSRQWFGITSSSDGIKIAAVVYIGNVNNTRRYNSC